MAYIGQTPSAVVTSSSQIQDGAVELQDISAAAQASLGTVDFYGFKKLANGTLELEYSNGSDNVSVANNDTSQSDKYAESFVSKRGLTFSVDASGNLNVTI
jgi:hypothetical protein|tara:strand:+ start:276 stop:578 length:303 start_codon:yes stop_codon:yes gene_type:complete